MSQPTNREPRPAAPLALLVSERPWAPAVRELLRVSGYKLRVERSSAEARLALGQVAPDLAIVGDLTLCAEFPDLLRELRANCPRLIVTHQRDAALMLAERLGFLRCLTPTPLS